MEGQQVGKAYKCFCIYKEAFWRKNGFTGMVLGPNDISISSIDNTPHNSKKGVMLSLVVADRVEEFEKLNEN